MRAHRHRHVFVILVTCSAVACTNGGSSSRPDGASPAPDGALVPPDGASPAPDGALAPPDAASPAPDGAVAPPDAAPGGAPTVIATSPTDGTAEVDPDVALEVTFSEDMAADTLSPSTFVVTCDGATVSGTVSYESSTHVATFRVAPRLTLRGGYAVTITTGATDVEGTPLAAPSAFGFTVRDGQWEAAHGLLAEDGAIAGELAVAVGGDGVTTVLWEQGGVGISVSRYVPGAGWDAASTLDAIGGDTPGIAADSAGNVTAVWNQFDSPPTDLVMKRLEPGAGWGATTPVEDDEAYAHHVGYLPRVAVDPAGNAIVVWDQNDGTESQLWARRFVLATGWEGPQLLGPGVNPWIVIDVAGDATVVWMQPDGADATSGYSMAARRYIAGTGWSAATLFDDGFEWASRARLAADAAGNVTAVWQQDDGTRSSIWTNRFEPGSGWGMASLLETQDYSAMYPDVAADPAGNVIALWQQFDGTAMHVWSRSFAPSTGWGTASRIETSSGPTANPAIAFDPAGNAVAVWEQGVVWASRDLWACRFVPGTGWDTPVLIDTTSDGSTYFPRIAIDPTGAAAVMWNRTNGPDVSGVQLRVWATVFR